MWWLAGWPTAEGPKTCVVGMCTFSSLFSCWKWRPLLLRQRQRIGGQFFSAVLLYNPLIVELPSLTSDYKGIAAEVAKSL